MELVARTRDRFGRGVKALRTEGLIPAELYGRGVPNLHLAVEARAFESVFREAGENTVVTVVVGGDKRPVLIHDVQRNFLNDSVDHIDFYQVRMDEKTTAHVPIEFTGEPPAVKIHGGILTKAMTEIEVEALPADLPHRLTVDLGGLAELNQSVYVKDIPVPAKVTVLVDPETVVVTVTEKMVEEEIAAPAEPVDVSAVKVETEEKKAEREKVKTESPETGPAEK